MSFHSERETWRAYFIYIYIRNIYIIIQSTFHTIFLRILCNTWRTCFIHRARYYRSYRNMLAQVTQVERDVRCQARYMVHEKIRGILTRKREFPPITPTGRARNNVSERITILIGRVLNTNGSRGPISPHRPRGDAPRRSRGDAAFSFWFLRKYRSIHRPVCDARRDQINER